MDSAIFSIRALHPFVHVAEADAAADGPAFFQHFHDFGRKPLSFVADLHGISLFRLTHAYIYNPFSFLVYPLFYSILYDRLQY